MKSILVRTCIQAGLDQIYHYQRFHVEYVTDVLSNNRIKFSDPSTFNDPWDCQPSFSKTILDKPDIYNRYVEYACDLVRRRDGLSDAEVAQEAALLHNDRSFLEKFIDGMTIAMSQAISNQYRVYCLSSDPSNFLMWAHYSDSHSGVCFGFNTRSLVFCGALEVNYREDYPQIDLIDDDDFAYLRDTLLTKAKSWSYEDEYRLIAKEGESDSFMVVDDSFASFEPQDLHSVIVGTSISTANIETIRELLARREHPVQLLQARPNSNKYALILEEI